MIRDLWLAAKIIITSAAAFGGAVVAVAPHWQAIAIWLACCVAACFIIRSELKS